MPLSTLSSISVDAIIQKGMDRWIDCENLPEMTLLRLALLRELNQSLHAEKSRCLACGKKLEVQSIKEWEKRLENLCDLATLPGTLADLLQSTSSIKKKKRLLPEGLFVNIDRDKLLRYDRKWEQMIAAEAAAIHWSFWALDIYTNIMQIEEWGIALSEALWPHGLVLFVESASNVRAPEVSETAGSELWRGHWMILLQPRFKHPEELSMNLSQWPGSPDHPPSQPAWKHLYTG